MLVCDGAISMQCCDARCDWEVVGGSAVLLVRLQPTRSE
jgi:hypothetical protein